MQVKKKKCTGGCGLEKVIWKNHEGKQYCKYCWMMRTSKQKLKTTTPVRIKPVSDKRQDELKIYRIKRDEYLKRNPICEFPGCLSTDIELHHKKGRIGLLLTDDRYFCSLCRKHHRWVEEHPEEAKKMNLTLSRLEQ